MFGLNRTTGIAPGKDSGGRFHRPIWRWLAGLGGTFLLLAVALWLRPSALFLYHLHAGERALETALAPVYPDRLAPEQVRDAAVVAAGIRHLEAAIRWNGRDVRPLRLLGRAYLSLGQPDAAMAALQQAVSLRPDDPALHLELADIYDSLGRTEDAIREYEAGGIGSRRWPLTANWLKLAAAQADSGSGELAIRFWRKALEVDPGNLCALYELYAIHQDLGDRQTAALYEAQLRNWNPARAPMPLDFRLAECQVRTMATLVEEGLWERETMRMGLSYQLWEVSRDLPALMLERALQQSLFRWPKDPDLLFALAELYQRRGDGERASGLYREVLSVAPDDFPAYWRLGMIGER